MADDKIIQRKIRSQLNRATIFEKDNKIERALAAYQKVLELDANNVKALAGVERLAKAGEKAQEQEKIKEYLQETKSAIEGNDFEEALDIVGKILEIDNENEDAIALRKHIDEAQSELERKEQIHDLTQQAQKLEQEKQFDKAIEILKQLLELDTDSIELKNKISELQDARNKIIREEKISEYLKNGIDLEKSGGYERAIEKFKSILELDESNKEAQEHINTCEEKIAADKKKPEKIPKKTTKKTTTGIRKIPIKKEGERGYVHREVTPLPGVTDIHRSEGSPIPIVITILVIIALGIPLFLFVIKPILDSKGEDTATYVKLWEYPTGGPIKSTPLIYNGRVYFGSNDYSIHCISATNMNYYWKKATGSIIDMASPAIGDNIVFIGSSDSKLYAFDVLNGEPKWKPFKTGRPITSTPAIYNGRVYITSQDGKLYSIDISSGTEIWTFPTKPPRGQQIYASPVIKNDVIYIAVYGAKSGTLYAIDVNKGTEIWKFKTDKGMYTTPAVDEMMVYVGSDNGKFYGLDVKTGEQKWVFEGFSGIIHSSPTVKGDLVYIGGADSKFFVLNRLDGTVVWEFLCEGPVACKPLIYNNIVYVAGGSRLYALNALTGEAHWLKDGQLTSFLTLGDIVSSPVRYQNILYVGSNDRNLYALQIE